MQTYEITQTQYKVADFLDWQRAGTLDLAPVFQRRTIWKPGAKSYLVDTVARGLPTPIIFLRDRVDLDSLQPTREVVDGQQRLRTLIGYIEPAALPDYDADRDGFTVQRNHNPDLARKKFSELDRNLRHRLLNYSFSTHVMPSSVEDREILMIFQRLNSTGEKLNSQELRNARWFGECKTLMYELALEQLERWRKWDVFSGDEIARMKEVELTSDFAETLVEGYGAKSQTKIDKMYKEGDEKFPAGRYVARRFRNVMDEIDRILGPELANSVFSREIWFMPLATLVHRSLYDPAKLSAARKRQHVPKEWRRKLLNASGQVGTGEDLSPELLDAIRGASSDQKSRRARLDFLAERV
jgi:hypothetical protein